MNKIVMSLYKWEVLEVFIYDYENHSLKNKGKEKPYLWLWSFGKLLQIYMNSVD